MFLNNGKNAVKSETDKFLGVKEIIEIPKKTCSISIVQGFALCKIHKSLFKSTIYFSNMSNLSKNVIAPVTVLQNLSYYLANFTLAEPPW